MMYIFPASHPHFVERREKLIDTQPLKGQKAFVTGAATGIGRGIVRALAQAGAAVVVNYIGNTQPAEEAAGEVQSVGGKALAIEADVTQEDLVKEMF